MRNVIRFAYSQKKNEAEILQGYVGIPISSLWTKINKETPEFKIQYMINVMRDATQKQINAVIFHMVTYAHIIFYLMTATLVEIPECHSTSITSSNKFKLVFMHNYSSLTFPGIIKELSRPEAITADLKALGLSVYKTGLTI